MPTSDRFAAVTLPLVSCVILAAPSAARGDIVPLSATRHIEGYLKLPPSWGGTEETETYGTTSLGAWSASALRVSEADQGSTIGANGVSGTFSYSADLASGINAPGTVEKALSKLNTTFEVLWPSTCHITGSYWTHIYLVGTSTISVELKGTSPVFAFSSTPPQGSDTQDSGDINQVTPALLPGQYSIAIDGHGEANAVTSLISGTGEGSLTMSFEFEEQAPQYLDVPAQYPTIGAAIAAATDFQTVRIAPGVYHEHLNLAAKQLRVQSSSPTENVVIDGAGGAGSLLTISGSQGRGTEIRGLTFRNSPQGSNVPAVGGPAGGGLLILNASPSIIDCRFETNHAEFGGGAFVSGGGPSFTRCVFLGNSAAAGGAIGFDAGSGPKSLVLDDCVLTCNEAEPGSGGALWIEGSPASPVAVTNSMVCNNSSPQIVPTGVAIDPSSQVCGCPGDLNNDASVGAADLSILIGAWGTAEVTADLDCDGAVGSSDLATLLGAWGAAGDCN
jgi:hypothetical protein